MPAGVIGPTRRSSAARHQRMSCVRCWVPGHWTSSSEDLNQYSKRWNTLDFLRQQNNSFFFSWTLNTSEQINDINNVSTESNLMLTKNRDPWAVDKGDSMANIERKINIPLYKNYSSVIRFAAWAELDSRRRQTSSAGLNKRLIVLLGHGNLWHVYYWSWRFPESERSKAPVCAEPPSTWLSVPTCFPASSLQQASSWDLEKMVHAACYHDTHTHSHHTHSDLSTEQRV